MRVHFLTSVLPKVASARFRAWWPAEAWASPDVTCGGPDHPAVATADVLVVTSLIGQVPMQWDSLTGRWLVTVPQSTVVVWDLTDPMWCYMGDAAFREWAGRVAHLTVSSEGLRMALATEFHLNATVIPDRLPYQATQRLHQEVAVPTLIWFGYGFNRWPAFSGVAPLLLRLRRNGVPFKLQIVDDQPQLPLFEGDRYGLAAITEHLAWALETMHDRLCAADVALLPPFPGWIGTMKSENRAMTAAWAGLPIVRGDSYGALVSLLTDVELRRSSGASWRAWAERSGNIASSVAQWQEVLAQLTTSDLLTVGTPS
jgi:hypothetical protein